MSQGTAAILVAAGSGKRLGADEPKAFIKLGPKPLFVHSFEVFAAHAAVNEIVVVAPSELQNTAQVIVSSAHCAKPITVIAGGKHRWQSVRSGVNACTTECEWVLVHDAARPFVTAAVINSLLEKKALYKCAITATPEIDTVRRFEADRCIETLDRTTIVRVGTPQLFHRQSLLKAFESAAHFDTPPTDEAMLMERAGFEVGLAWGDPLNFKITTPQDFKIAEALVLKTEKSKQPQSD